MPLLYYVRQDNHERDARFGFVFHLNQNSLAMASVGTGESLWAFTRRCQDDQYVLAAELVVRVVTRNPPNYRYGRCQACLYDPPDVHGHRTCQGHHIQWLSRGGEDDLRNMMLVCPNHHAATHREDAAFD